MVGAGEKLVGQVHERRNPFGGIQDLAGLKVQETKEPYSKSFTTHRKAAGHFNK
jgi:hypothetical protein